MRELFEHIPLSCKNTFIELLIPQSLVLLHIGRPSPGVRVLCRVRLKFIALLDTYFKFVTTFHSLNENAFTSLISSDRTPTRMEFLGFSFISFTFWFCHFTCISYKPIEFIRATWSPHREWCSSKGRDEKWESLFQCFNFQHVPFT